MSERIGAVLLWFHGIGKPADMCGGVGVMALGDDRVAERVALGRLV